jgi:hypothetical protein
VRRANDFYPTPEWATLELLKHVSIRGTVFECCVGDGAIARPLATDRSFVYTGDIDPQWNPQVLGDANDREFWESASRLIEADMDIPGIDWIVTNPPFNEASTIVPIAYNRAEKGIAMLLRLSFLEPVEARGAWLTEHPPTCLIILPRISFTGDGKTDSVTCAWMVWDKAATQQRIIVAENPKFTVRDEPQEGLFANA